MLCTDKTIQWLLNVHFKNFSVPSSTTASLCKQVIIAAIIVSVLFFCFNQVLEGKPIYVDCFGNLVPLTKSGQHHIFSFFAFKENRLPLFVKVICTWNFCNIFYSRSSKDLTSFSRREYLLFNNFQRFLKPLSVKF